MQRTGDGMAAPGSGGSALSSPSSSGVSRPRRITQGQAPTDSYVTPSLRPVAEEEKEELTRLPWRDSELSRAEGHVNVAAVELDVEAGLLLEGNGEELQSTHQQKVVTQGDVEMAVVECAAWNRDLSADTARQATPKDERCLYDEANPGPLRRTGQLGVGAGTVGGPGGSCNMAPIVLQLSGVEKSYPIADSANSVVALKDINLIDNAGERGFDAVRRGEFVMIRGPSGGGKTTLLNIIGTIDSPTKGTVELLGERIEQSSKESQLARIRLEKIGFVFQTFNLISTMTAAENVELPMTLLGKLTEKERRLRSRQLLALVGLRNRVGFLPSELSGGEQQRVTIARSLANNPAVLLLDEPTGDLDTSTTIEVMDLLLRINRLSQTTCIMVTHNPDVECYADRILYVSDGRFVKEARNLVPKRLEPKAYAAYLEEREKERTRATSSSV